MANGMANGESCENARNRGEPERCENGACSRTVLRKPHAERLLAGPGGSSTASTCVG